MEFEEDDEEGEGEAAVPPRVGLGAALFGALLGRGAAPADDDGAAAAAVAEEDGEVDPEM
jgi:hypothetical protein|tara:strand:- start:2078 stop:2257 length:180 start_codon:yes stop_codon:yes gene_type:complete